MSAAAEQLIADGIALTGRECGKCSLCCKLLKVPDLDKEQGVWCKHCAPGAGGCTVYETRPPVCRDYACMWLTMPQIGDEWRPLDSGMIMDLGMHFEQNLAILRVHVDESVAGRWREEPYYSQIKKMATIGLYRKEKHFQTVVSDAGRKWIILPDRDVDAAKPGLLVRDENGKLDYIVCESQEEVRRLGVRRIMEACLNRALKETPDNDPNGIVNRMAQLIESADRV
jgi:hypothetical protein